MSNEVLLLDNNDLLRCLRGRIPFRTHPAAGINNTRWKLGTFHGHTKVLENPVWNELDENTKLRMPDLEYQTGSLSDDATHTWYSHFIQMYFVNQKVDFVVYSYDTVIAWHTTDEDGYWIVTQSVHSATTAQHQTRLILALQQLGERVT